MKNNLSVCMLLFLCSHAFGQADTCRLKIDLGPDLAICRGDSLVLAAEDGFEQYLWSDSEKVKETLVHPGDTVWLQVTDSNGCMAADTIVIGEASSLIKGLVRGRGILSIQGATVCLLRFEASDTAVHILDSTHTDSTGAYSFPVKNGSYYLRAHKKGKFLPAYWEGADIFQMATEIAVEDCDTASANMMIKDIPVANSSLSIGGRVMKAGRACSGLRLILYDRSNEAVGFSVTNEAGEFHFGLLMEGSYRIWADHPFVDNAGSVEIAVSSELAGKEHLTLQLHPSYLEVKEYSGKSIEMALKSPEKTFRLLLNSLSYTDKAASLALRENEVLLKPEIGKLINLERLELSFNQITALPEELGQLQRLQYLVLTGNKLRGLPAALSGLSALKELNLKNNVLNSFPQSILQMHSLEKLVLKINNISSIPAAISQLSRLRELDLGSNFGLETLPPEFTKLSMLEKLRLESCSALKELPEGMEQMKRLKYINLSYTKISPRKVEALRQALPACKIKYERK